MLESAPAHKDWIEHGKKIGAVVMYVVQGEDEDSDIQYQPVYVMPSESINNIKQWLKDTGADIISEHKLAS